jgi:hypothetical protein
MTPQLGNWSRISKKRRAKWLEPKYLFLPPGMACGLDIAIAKGERPSIVIDDTVADDKVFVHEGGHWLNNLGGGSLVAGEAWCRV